MQTDEAADANKSGLPGLNCFLCAYVVAQSLHHPCSTNWLFECITNYQCPLSSSSLVPGTLVTLVSFCLYPGQVGEEETTLFFPRSMWLVPG